MSSIPVANDGTLAGIRLIGCEQEATHAPNPSHCTPPSPPGHGKKPEHPQPSQSLLELPRREEYPAPSRRPVPRDLPSGGKHASTPVLPEQERPSVSLARGDSAHPPDSDPNGIPHHHSDRPALKDCSQRNASGQNGSKMKQEDSEDEELPMKFHRAREVRLQQGVSVRSMARRLNLDARSYKRLEDPSTDLSLSELMMIQKALDVPLVDLLVDRNSLSRPVEERAKLVKTMKTAVALRETKSTPRVERMARMLCEQLVDLMPELQEVSGWPKFGARRGENALGKALCQPIDMSQIRSLDS